MSSQYLGKLLYHPNKLPCGFVLTGIANSERTTNKQKNLNFLISNYFWQNSNKNISSLWSLMILIASQPTLSFWYMFLSMMSRETCASVCLMYSWVCTWQRFSMCSLTAAQSLSIRYFLVVEWNYCFKHMYLQCHSSIAEKVKSTNKAQMYLSGSWTFYRRLPTAAKARGPEFSSRLCSKPRGR